MAISVNSVRAAAQRAKSQSQKSERVILSEAFATSNTSFNIFLSHSSRDREIVIGTKQLIEEAGYTVYVDWIDDAELENTAVDRRRADHLRKRMRQCETMFYAHTPNAALSKWCPWELGYFDAMSHPDCQVYVLPIVNEGENYKGQEYLSLYDVVDLQSYRHRPKKRREMDAFRRERLADTLGLRRNPFRGPIL